MTANAVRLGAGHRNARRVLTTWTEASRWSATLIPG
jgi:hypothetical protein